jgi:hypothetical protein
MPICDRASGDGAKAEAQPLPPKINRKFYKSNNGKSGTNPFTFLLEALFSLSTEFF